MKTDDFDVLIVGAGLVGASLAIALADIGLTVGLIEANPMSQLQDNDFDARSLALAKGSQQILSTLNLWDELKINATAIECIHISEQNRLGVTRLKETEPLGYVAEIHDINRILHQRVDKSANITLFNPARVTSVDENEARVSIDYKGKTQTLDARIVIAADGGNSSIRQLLKLPVSHKNYNQKALVANIGLKRHHKGHAFERFSPKGPIALLPLSNNRASLVWANSEERTNHLLSLTDDAFLKELQHHFGYRLGRFIKCGKRQSFPLSLSHLKTPHLKRIVCIGNAAHTLHPIAGQGFNLGLRDVAMLAQILSTHGLNDKALEHYAAKRTKDTNNMIRFTDGLISLFTNTLPLLDSFRSKSLLLLDNSPWLKKPFNRFATGLSGQTSKLASGIALKETSQ